MSERIMTLRLPQLLYEDLQIVARAEDKSISAVVRDAITDHVARRLKDESFKQRLAERIEADQAILKRLRDG